VAESSGLRRLLARRIREVKARRGMVALADLAGVSAAHLYDVVKCKKAATVDFIEKIAGALDVEPWQLLRDSGDAGRDQPEHQPPRPVRPQRPPARR
jgi:transcriptional regulator with XRE-family HTH domain